MASPQGDRDLRKRMERLDTLIQEVERFENPRLQAHTREIVQTLLDLHGVGLERMLDHVAQAGEVGLGLIDELAQDEVVRSLLLLHGLHPQDIETRVRLALDKVRPYLRSHGGNVELLGMAQGLVRLRMVGSCDGCPSSAMTLKLAIEEAIFEAAPDVAGIEVAGMVENGAPAQAALKAGAELPGNERSRVALPLVPA